MKPDLRFLNQPTHFWANVRTLSQAIGYTIRGRAQIRVPSSAEMRNALRQLGLGVHHIEKPDGRTTALGKRLQAYFAYRANVLNSFVEPNLMNAAQAKVLFEKLRKKLRPTCPMPLNKQKGRKKAPAFLTCIVNMLVEAHSGGLPCDYDPRQLTTVTIDDVPLRTLARRVDGAFPSPVNPIAI